MKNEKRMLKIKNFSFLVFIFTFSFLLFTLSQAQAESMDSPNYKLEWTNLNMTSGEKSSANYKVTDTVGQTAVGDYTSTGYLIRTGFQNIYPLAFFKFSVSKTSINFGSLSPNTPVTQAATLTVSSAGTHGYRVTVIADNKLRKNEKVFIPDTQCDDLKDKCSVINAKPWTSDQAYGFGYNMHGMDIPKTFMYETYFRPFPLQAADKPATIMRDSLISSERQANITFKVNIPDTQEAGQYQNQINFVAIPSY